MKRLLTILVTFMAVLSSCTENIINDMPQTDPDKPSRPEDYGDFVLQDDVKFIAEAYGGYILETIDTAAIIISNDIPEELKPEVGDVIYCMVTPNTPNGFAGRVVSLEPGGGKTRYETQNVLITEIFEELKISQSVDLPEDMTYMLDSEGNRVEIKPVSNDIWDELVSDQPESKAGFGSSVAHTLEIGTRDSKYFNGAFYLGFELGLDIDISLGKLNKIEFYSNTQCGIKGDLSLWSSKSENKIKVVDMELKTPVAITVGPLVFITTIGIEEGFMLNGKAELKGEMKFELDNTNYSFKYENNDFKATCTRNHESERFFCLSKFEASAEVGIYSEVSIGLSPYHSGLLKFGVGTAPKYKVSAEAEISFDDKELLSVNPELSVARELEMGIFCESKLLGKLSGKEEKLGLFVNQTLTPISIPLLPAFTNTVTEKVNKTIKCAADLVKDNFVNTSEEGFALFDKNDQETPLQHREMEITAAKSSDGHGTAVFEVDDPDKYVVKPYVIADEQYFYLSDDRWVDLGLPSGILWAAYNVGATSPEEYGGYYAWGETEEKSSYTWENYKYYNPLTESFIYIGNDISGTQYDVAHVKWGDGARMPNKDDIQELINNCSWSPGTLSGVSGATATGPNGDSVFFPYSGRRYPDGVHNSTTYGYYWSGTCIEDNDDGIDNYVYTLYCGTDYGFVFEADWNWHLNYGQNVRPVKDKPKEKQ